MNEERTHTPGPTLSRRGLMRIAGGTALATTALATTGVQALRGAPAGPDDTPGDVAMRLVATSAQLLVRDGTPHWWNSPDIWVVPGTDPTAPPGPPVAGDTAYVWARVANTGRDDAIGVQVRFYWANPSVQMLYSGINLIGTAVADVPAGTSQDVLCLVPWNVVTVNGGHECLVVVAAMPGDPPLPDVVDPVGYPNVAQRNLTVVSGLVKGERDFHLMVTVNATRRAGKTVLLGAELGRELPKETLASLGVRQERPAERPAVEVGLSREPIKDPEQGIGEPTLEVTVPPGRSVPVYVTVRGTGELPPERYQVVHVIERQKDETLGGISFVVVAE